MIELINQKRLDKNNLSNLFKPKYFNDPCQIGSLLQNLQKDKSFIITVWKQEC